MRDPIAVGYLLARLSDTVADSGNIPLLERRKVLGELAEQVENPETSISLRKFVDKVNHAGEKNLLAAAPEILGLLRTLNAENRRAVQKVLKTIISGQTWDLERFEPGYQPITEWELMNYTYLVAGCVGEFWTEVGYINLGEHFALQKDQNEMMIWGRKLGQGLQLVNIIRDLYEDIPRGRLYLPDHDYSHWLEVCRDNLSAGSQYVRKVRNSQVRFATALPHYLAEATASKLANSGPDQFLRKKIKLPRSTIWKLATRAALFT